MSDKSTEQALEEHLESFAAIEHQRWSHWQAYLHSKCVRQRDGSLVIPAELVKHWESQIATPYYLLSEEEKQSDRDQVRLYLPLLKIVVNPK